MLLGMTLTLGTWAARVRSGDSAGSNIARSCTAARTLLLAGRACGTTTVLEPYVRVARGLAGATERRSRSTLWATEPPPLGASVALVSGRGRHAYKQAYTTVAIRRGFVAGRSSFVRPSYAALRDASLARYRRAARRPKAHGNWDKPDCTRLTIIGRVLKSEKNTIQKYDLQNRRLLLPSTWAHPHGGQKSRFP